MLLAHKVASSVVVPSVPPDLGQFPGSQELRSLLGGLEGWALLLALVGLLVGAAAWALGVHAQNFQQTYAGRRAVLVAGLAALLIGAAPGLVDFFFSAGQNFH